MNQLNDVDNDDRECSPDQYTTTTTTTTTTTPPTISDDRKSNNGNIITSRTTDASTTDAAVATRHTLGAGATTTTNAADVASVTPKHVTDSRQSSQTTAGKMNHTKSSTSTEYTVQRMHRVTNHKHTLGRTSIPILKTNQNDQLVVQNSKDTDSVDHSSINGSNSNSPPLPVYSPEYEKKRQLLLQQEQEEQLSLPFETVTLPPNQKHYSTGGTPINSHRQHHRRHHALDDSPSLHPSHQQQQLLQQDCMRVDQDDEYDEIRNDNEEEESSNYFVSEPSISEDGESQHYRRFQVAQHLPVSRNIAVGPPSGYNTPDDDNIKHRRSTANTAPTNHTPMQQQQQHSRRQTRHTNNNSNRLSSSPGNTSLSSWDHSPWRKKQVVLQFVMPESKRDKFVRAQQQQNSPTATSLSVRSNRNNRGGEPVKHHSDKGSNFVLVGDGVSIRRRKSDHAAVRGGVLSTMDPFLDHRSTAEPNESPVQLPFHHQRRHSFGYDSTEFNSGAPSSAATQAPGVTAFENSNTPMLETNSHVTAKTNVQHRPQLPTQLQLEQKKHQRPVSNRYLPGAKLLKRGSSFLQNLRSLSDLVSTTTPDQGSKRSNRHRSLRQNEVAELNGLDYHCVSRKSGTFCHAEDVDIRDLLMSPTSVNPNSIEDSLAMTLSDSEIGGAIDDSVHSDRPLDWEAHNSADDEKTEPRRIRRRSAKSNGSLPGHKRNRSRDEIATKIATGGRDWKAMDTNGKHVEMGNESLPAVVSNRRSQRYIRRVSSGNLPGVEYPQDRPAMADSDSRQAWIDQMKKLHQIAALEHSQYSGDGSLHETPHDSLQSDGESQDSDDEGNVEDDDGMDDSTACLERALLDEEGDLHLNYAKRIDPIVHHRDGSSSVDVPRPFQSMQSQSPFINLGKQSAEKAPRSSFLPKSFPSEDTQYPTFLCPRCNTRQREFFTVANAAAGRLEGPGSYLAFYCVIYVVCSLFIFGLEEGWMPLDCTYFAVITLTTAGLGDFVPTSDLNKIICSIFIYFGVACIGLLLGSYIAGMLDDKARRDQKEKQIDSCPNCARIRMVKECALRRSGDYIDSSFGATQNKKFMSERMAEGLPMNPAPAVSHHHHSHQPFSLIDRPDTHSQNIERGLPNMSDILMGHGSPASPILTSSSSPMQFLGRQSHTRHASFDVGQQGSLLRGVLPTGYGATSNSRARSIPVGGPDTSTSPHIAKSRLRTIASSDNLLDGFSESDAESSIESTSTESSTEEVWDSAKSRIQAGKYVVLTLRLALVNSLVIIAVGCVGFWLIEGFSLIDSWYFTTVLLTTVGYGDIVPVTDGGKLFATIYILVAGTILLNNMSSISMIPIELRRRRIQRTILTQFGDHLDDAALRELATGPVVQRLRLAANRADGLDECTREMFSLAMLVRLGKVTEHDIRETFASFRHLDVHNEGVLNSKSIIGGLIAKQRIRASASMANFPPPTDQMRSLSSMTASQPPQTSTEQEKILQAYWFGQQGSLHVDTNESNYYFHEPYSTYNHDDHSILPDEEGVSWLP